MRKLKQCVVMSAACLSSLGAWAGNLDSAGAPTAPASAMYRIEDVYNRLDTGVVGDADLAAGNIQYGVSIFGVTGSVRPAPVAKTGATDVGNPVPASYTEAGEDGHASMRKGVAWPGTRFSTDTPVAGMNAETYANLGYTDWRLPNVQELQSLIDYGKYSPALPAGHPFTGVLSSLYWSSTTVAGTTTVAWRVDLADGLVIANFKSNSYYVWPVRGP